MNKDKEQELLLTQSPPASPLIKRKGLIKKGLQITKKKKLNENNNKKDLKENPLKRIYLLEFLIHGIFLLV